MKLTFLGTGTSIGVPAIGCQCEVCRSTNPKDKRLRASAIVETNKGLRVLIDCGPDFRQQILTQRFGKIDAVLITHIHYDHVGGADDLRPFCMYGDVDVYAQHDVVEGLHETMPYCFRKHLYPGVPHLHLHEARAGEVIRVTRPHEITVDFPGSGASLNGVMNKIGHREVVPSVQEVLDIVPVPVLHGKLQILGYRFGKMAYITDMKEPSPVTLSLLQGVETLVINALRFEKEHHSHQLVNNAIDFSRAVGAKQTYLTHLTHDIGTHDIANKKLPEGFLFAYDGMDISF
ncbi:MAG: MBL fold metallo-hydrolase [Prevotella sp.]|nr:MBL fold metallo-hydrolase [Prevotella sp.]